MLQGLRQMLTSRARTKRLASSRIALREAVEQLLATDLSSAEAKGEHERFAQDLLRAFESHVDTMRQQASGYPANPIRGDVWTEGVELAQRAGALAEHFRGAGWLGPEYGAAKLAHDATMAVCSHYPHFAGPAVIALADVEERLGHRTTAREHYEGIVRDFADVVDHWREAVADPELTDGPGQDLRISLDCLRRATRRLLALDATSVHGHDLEALARTTEELLAR